MIPIWKPSLCTQCNYCVAACPHAAIRAKVADPADFSGAPDTLQRLPVKSRDMKGMDYVLQVAPRIAPAVISVMRSARKRPGGSVRPRH